MFKMKKVFLIVLGIVMMLSTKVSAWDNVYRYLPDLYDAQSNLEPVGYGAEYMCGGDKFGYADKDGNIKISIHDNWDNASKFNNGMAVVYDKNIKTCLAIDTNGNTVFQFEPNTEYSQMGSPYDKAELRILDNDPNGMFCAYIRGSGNSSHGPNSMNVTLYDRKGNHNTIDLRNYDSISEYKNGVFTLSKIKKRDVNHNGDFTFVNYYYKPIAKMDTNGVINDILNPLKVTSRERLAGNTRYETAAAISQKGWTQSDSVVLTNGESHTEALVGSSFAYLKNAPILITPPNKLNANISKEIERLKAKTVYILGNYESISQNVENELKVKYNVVRIGGSQVFDTAVKVGEEVRKIKQFDSVFLVSPEDFPDALSAAPFSASKTIPILFVNKDYFGEDTFNALQNWGIKHVYILGGYGVISRGIDDPQNSPFYSMGVKDYKRLCGEDRYGTANEIIKEFAPQGSFTDIAVASGANYPDALTGAVLAAKSNMPLVLVDKYGATEEMAQYLHASTLNKAYIFGGESVVNKDIFTSN